MRKTGLALALTCAALAGAGCGEDAKFIDDYNAATKPLQELQKDLGGTRPDSRNAGQELDRLANVARKVNNDLADLKAPSDAQADFDKLRAALKKSEQDLRDVASATKGDDITKLTTATQALANDTREIDKAEAAVKKKVED